MKKNRRSFLHFAGGAGAVFIAAAAGLLKTGIAWAAPWNKNAFEAKAEERETRGLISMAIMSSFASGETAN